MTDGKANLTYAELHDLVLEEAAALRRDGALPGTLVPLQLTERRTVRTIVSLLAILAVGAAFIPVPAGSENDPAIRSIGSGGPAWPGHLSPLSTPAYVLSTSGSTGTAKHALVTREGLRAVFGGLHAVLHGRIPPGATWTQLHPLTFGFSLCEVFGSLTFAGTLVLVEREEPLTFTALSRLLSERTGPQVVCLTPSELSVLLSAENASLPSHLLLSGEPAHRAPLRDLFERTRNAPPVVVNTYAATETSGQVTADLVTAERLEAVLSGHVGRPIPGVEVVLLGPDGEPVSPDDTVTEGEIEVRGATVAAGYLDPDAHRAKFATTHRAFRTGDRGRWALDGGLVVTGRGERRVKLAGRWTALDAVEQALTEDGLVAEAVAAAEEYPVDGEVSAGRLLVAVVPAAAAPAETAARVRRRVLRLLDGPVTVRVVVREAISRTAHGKTDLAAPHHTSRAQGRGDGLADTVMGVWTELLGAGFSADANLFESGVDSLGVVAAATRLTAALGREISPSFLLDHPRITLQIKAFADQRAQPGNISQAPSRVRQASHWGTVADRRRAARRPDSALSTSVSAEGAMP